MGKKAHVRFHGEIAASAGPSCRPQISTIGFVDPVSAKFKRAERTAPVGQGPIVPWHT